mmetsp:Transcript_47014/g.106480  ORF Transcript_47014/g.106480 Transcript_47014/m.106480 type:complete len:226 (-) Transcript_47014:104-781(-)
MQLSAILFFALTSIFGIGEASNARGIEFLAEKEKEDGVVKLDSGLLYKVLRKGTGKAHPLVGTTCECHYEGTLIDGDKFDSSYDRGEPTSFAPNQVIAGWTEAMQLMVEGDKWEMYIPSELAYGSRGSPPKIGPDETLVFRMEIIKINGKTKPSIVCNVANLEDCDETEKPYVEKAKKKGAEWLGKELPRLKGMKETGQMKPEARNWIIRRIELLKRINDLKGEL